MTISPVFRDWALEKLNQSNDQEIHDRTLILETVATKLLDTQKQLDNLTKCVTEILLMTMSLRKRKRSFRGRYLVFKSSVIRAKTERAIGSS